MSPHPDVPPSTPRSPGLLDRVADRVAATIGTLARDLAGALGLRPELTPVPVRADAPARRGPVSRGGGR